MTCNKVKIQTCSELWMVIEHSVFLIVSCVCHSMFQVVCVSQHVSSSVCVAACFK